MPVASYSSVKLGKDVYRRGESLVHRERPTQALGSQKAPQTRPPSFTVLTARPASVCLLRRGATRPRAAAGRRGPASPRQLFRWPGGLEGERARLSALCLCRSGHQPDRAAHPGHPERRHLQVAPRVQRAEPQEDVSRAGRPSRGADLRQAIAPGVQQQAPLSSGAPGLPGRSPAPAPAPTDCSTVRAVSGEACPPPPPGDAAAASSLRLTVQTGGGGGGGARGSRGSPLLWADLTCDPQPPPGWRQALLLPSPASSRSGSFESVFKFLRSVPQNVWRASHVISGASGSPPGRGGCPSVFDGNPRREGLCPGRSGSHTTCDRNIGLERERFPFLCVTRASVLFRYLFYR